MSSAPTFSDTLTDWYFLVGGLSNLLEELPSNCLCKINRNRVPNLPRYVESSPTKHEIVGKPLESCRFAQREVAMGPIIQQDEILAAGNAMNPRLYCL